MSGSYPSRNRDHPSSTRSIIRPLGVGNVVNAGLSLYRSHLKAYLSLSLRAHLWSLIPIYGWAKFQMLSAAIARHSFQEMLSQPEPLRESERRVRPHLWLFFGLQIIVGLILLGINIGLSVVQFVVVTLPFLAIIDTTIGDSGLFVVVRLMINVIFYIAYLWFWSRLFIPALPLAIDGQTDIIDNIGRSWQLTSGLAVRVLIIISIVTLITLPLYLLALLPVIILFLLFFPFVVSGIEGSFSTATIIALLLLTLLGGIVMFLLVSTLIMPIWQATKAVLYCDVRSRREGLGLRLRHAALVSPNDSSSEIP
ncbi:MAG TPA: DUF975 domain-containing protein [Elainellaceae cyanobacterium]